MTYDLFSLLFGIIILLILIGVVLYAAIKLARSNQEVFGTHFDGTLVLLSERLTRVEISKDEYKDKELIIRK